MKIRTDFGPYTESFKVFLVEEVESGRITQAEAKRKYDILGHSTILKWCRKYGKLQYPSTEERGKTVNKIKKSYDTLRLENEIKALKQELEDTRFKNVVLETMVDIAEKEFGIPIRKKPGARQSAK